MVFWPLLDAGVPTNHEIFSRPLLVLVRVPTDDPGFDGHWRVVRSLELEFDVSYLFGPCVSNFWGDSWEVGWSHESPEGAATLQEGKLVLPERSAESAPATRNRAHGCASLTWGSSIVAFSPFSMMIPTRSCWNLASAD